jgi:hypothetical protein
MTELYKGKLMEIKKVDFTRSIYTVSGSNLAFESREMVMKYLHKKWGINEQEVAGFAMNCGAFESGVDVLTLRINDNEVKILQRRVVTEDNLEAAIQLNW